jgi:hypothetical protein
MTAIKIWDDMSSTQLKELAQRKRDSQVMRRLLGILAGREDWLRKWVAAEPGHYPNRHNL